MNDAHKKVYLGHVISKEGIQADPAKIEAAQKWPQISNEER